MTAKVYAVTTMHAAAEGDEDGLPFQIAIVEVEGKARQTVRIVGPRVAIGDEVVKVGELGEAPLFGLREE
jgi:uncharacterized OB-fold protein